MCVKTQSQNGIEFKVAKHALQCGYKGGEVYEKGYTQNTKDCGGHFRECMGNLRMAENMTEAVCTFQLPISRRCVVFKYQSLREHNNK